MTSKISATKKPIQIRTDQTENCKRTEASKIRKFKAIQSVGLFLLVSPVITFIFYFVFFSAGIPSLFRIIPYTTLVSIFACILSDVDYYSFYTNLTDHEKHHRIFVFHNLLYIDVFVLLVFMFSVFVQSMNGTVYVFMLISLYPISFLLKYSIVKKNGFQITNDRLSRVYILSLISLVLVFIFLQAFILFFDFFYDLGIEIFVINEQLIKLKVLYEIGPVIISLLFFARRKYALVKA